MDDVVPAAAAAAKGHGASVLDASAPEFRPGCSSFAAVLAPEDASSAGASPSLIFGGGGRFLSKYSHVRHEAGHDGPRQRRTGEPPSGLPTPTQSASSSARPGCGSSPGAFAGPDRVNVQLNSLLVTARTWEKILQVVETHDEDFNAVNLITALHRLATIVVNSRKGQLRRDLRFKRMVHRLSDTVRNAETGALKPQDLSNIAWALTRLGLLNSVLFGHLAEHIIRTIHLFEPVNISMTLWAFARSGFLDEKLFSVAAAEVKGQLSRFEPQQIANTTWAMAKSGFVDEELFETAAQLALEKIEEFQPMNSSMLLYSFALARLPHPKLFAEVGRRCTASTLASAASMPHVVTNLALAYSEAGVSNSAVFDAVAVAAGGALYDFRTQQIATLVHAFARAEAKTARVRHAGFFDAVSRAVAKRQTEFKPQDLEELRDAYDLLGLSTAPILKAMGSGDDKQDRPAPVLIAFLVVIVALLLLALASAGRLPGAALEGGGGGTGAAR
mmetsp:Transcript_18774/g.51934  ORF Transcript_18774/g.51934 Transcript_18774/m.51934 type:complete len:501 (+) Transcript_18774:59-1561(+)